MAMDTLAPGATANQPHRAVAAHSLFAPDDGTYALVHLGLIFRKVERDLELGVGCRSESERR